MADNFSLLAVPGVCFFLALVNGRAEFAEGFDDDSKWPFCSVQTTVISSLNQQTLRGSTNSAIA